MNDPDSPHVIAMPPLVFLVGFLIGLLLEWLVPLDRLSGITVKCIGVAVATASGILALWGRATMHRAGTNIDPRAPALVVVSNGPFQFTRNPLYLSLVLLTLGIALAFDLLWVIATLIPVVLIIHFGVILREERYLAAKFGQTYLDYKSKVRRWV
ncbi:MAG: isoprenylcysteine carboxylmethyltransferase family protein [Tepidisphaeraceae bacterium]|jgi:protein-S-isoprenylcysteine O-methyltransferase Ste14